MPVPSDIQIVVGIPGSSTLNITERVMYSSASFDSNASAGVGTFSVTLKDPDQTLDASDLELMDVGRHLWLVLDDKRYYGGFIMQRDLGFAFPAVNTTDLDEVSARQYTLRGVTYNAMFDRFVAHDPTDHYNRLHDYPVGAIAGHLVKNLCDDFLDIPGNFDTDTYVDDVGVADPQGRFAWVRGGEQGVSWREEMEWVTLKNAAIYYIDADRNLHFHSPDSVFSPWGFSDRPNNATVLADVDDFQGALYGFREMDTQKDITGITNDVFIWGGSEWSATGEPGDTSGIVFARRTNSDSISQHGRWQSGELHFGELGMGIQEGVDARAQAIVGGPNSPYVSVGTTTGPEGTVTRNQSIPAWNVRLSWYAHDVPVDNDDVRRHLNPGDIVTIVLWVHGTSPTKPLILTLPLRSVHISFPTLPSNTGGDRKTFVRFDGTFSLSVEDPGDLWRAILRNRAQIRRSVLSVANPDSTGVPQQNAIWQGAPAQTANGTRVKFTLETGGTPIRYYAGTSELYLNGLRMRQGADYSEQPTEGAITFFSAPPTGSTIWAYVRVAAP